MNRTQIQFEDDNTCYPFQTDCATTTPDPTAPPATTAPAPTGEAPDPGPLFGDGPKDAIFGGLLPIPEQWSWGDVGHVLIVAGSVLGALLVLAMGMSAAAWFLGWQVARLRNWALASLLALPGLSTLTHGLDPVTPGSQFVSGATMFLDGRYGYGLAVMGIVIVPAAWIVAALAYASHLTRLFTNGFPDPARTERAMWAYAQRQQRAAARLSRYRLPFTSGGLNPHIVFGRLAREEHAAPPRSRLQALFQRTRTLLVVPWIKLREHMVLVANSGAGKSTLMLRLLLSWYVVAWLRHRQWWNPRRPGRPMVVVIDCNGGPDSIGLSARVKRWFLGLGVPAERIGEFPRDVQLKVFGLPRDHLRGVLNAMVSGGTVPSTDTEKYFYEIRVGLINLITHAPAQVIDGEPIGENPPGDVIEFLARFDPAYLAQLWGGVYDPDPKSTKPWTGVPGVDREIQAALNGKQPVMDSARMEFGNLFRALGDAFDGEHAITDFDVLYCVLDGATQPDRARAQFGAIGYLLEQLADVDHGREALLAVDEFSAVSNGRTRADAWVMRMRKAHIGTLWIAQDWNGLGADDDQRESLVAAGAGGAILGRQERGSKLCETFGTGRRFELSRKLINGAGAGDEGNVQASEQFLVSPTKLRLFERGDIVWVSGGRARYGHVAPLDDDQLAMLRPLPGLAAMREPDLAPIAPVIELPKRRPTH
ncbi:AAA family ATPase [Nocardia sp. 2]|uniref:AAA family ATPase n=1 Tax=Nocardia acididurans TaxID=2802282 RepID=A0ABS1MFR8_9NOCA|nr:AAA family ATPase [Nocardia acididurans]MBL1079488.1 AAA family ATPase [Nocardia acididurans]